MSRSEDAYNSGIHYGIAMGKKDTGDKDIFLEALKSFRETLALSADPKGEREAGKAPTEDEVQILSKHHSIAAINFADMVNKQVAAHDEWFDVTVVDLFKEAAQYLKTSIEGDYVTRAQDKIVEEDTKQHLIDNYLAIGQKMAEIHIADGKYDKLKLLITEIPKIAAFALNGAAVKVQAEGDYAARLKEGKLAFEFLKNLSDHEYASCQQEDILQIIK